MIKVYSHPRSGTNYLCALLAQNFYPHVDLTTQAGVVGHWANRAQVPANPHGKLFGGHGQPSRYKLNTQSVYIFRDGRDVSVSLWRSKHFKHPSWEGLTFSEFIRKPLDWLHSPGDKFNNTQTVFEHWRTHLEKWQNSGAVLVRFENLVINSERTLERIAVATQSRMVVPFTALDGLVGWFPNAGKVAGWRDVMSDDDLSLFDFYCSGCYGVYDI